MNQHLQAATARHIRPRAIWKPTREQLRAIRAYCARVERLRPKQIVIEIGERYNVEDPTIETSANIAAVSREQPMDPAQGWDDTDLHDFLRWSDFVRDGMQLTREGECLIDLYISDKQPVWGGGVERGMLLGNSQVYARLDPVTGRVRVVGFSATCQPYEPVNI